MTLEIEFDNTRSNATDELPNEMGRVVDVVVHSIRGRLSKGYVGSVLVSITSAAVEES